MAEFQSSSGEDRGQLVHLVQHNKDNEAEVELLGEDRYVGYSAIALLQSGMKATVPMEGTCGPEEEEVVRREMVGEFARLNHTKRVELGRKAIKNYRNCVCNRMKNQQATVEIPTQEERVGKCKGVLKGAVGPRKTPRTRAQTAQAESVASRSEGA
jgi:hypothetical protein